MALDLHLAGHEFNVLEDFPVPAPAAKQNRIMHQANS